MTVGSTLSILIGLLPATKMTLTKAIETKTGEQGMIATMRNAKKDLRSRFPCTNNQRSLGQQLETMVPANPKATTATNTQRTILPVKINRKAVAVAAKKGLTAVETKITAERMLEATNRVHRMRIAIRDVMGRYHQQRSQSPCQIITLP